MKTITVEGVEYVAVRPLAPAADLACELAGLRDRDPCGLCPFVTRDHGGCTSCDADQLFGSGRNAVLIPADLLPMLKMRVPPGTLQHS